MKKASVFCLALCLLVLTACGHAPKASEEASDLEVNTHEGVTMTVVDGSAYPGQVKVTILNTTDTEIDSGNSAVQPRFSGPVHPPFEKAKTLLNDYPFRRVDIL